LPQDRVGCPPPASVAPGVWRRRPRLHGDSKTGDKMLAACFESTDDLLCPFPA
jgi:hypothetical protein